MFIVGAVNAAPQRNAPPLSPNYCEGNICLLASPVPQPEKRRTVVASFAGERRGPQNIISVSYDELGAVQVAISRKSTSGVPVQGSPTVDFMCGTGELCTVEISASPNLEPKAGNILKCQIVRVWIMKSGYWADRADVISRKADKIIDFGLKDGVCVGNVVDVIRR